MKRKANRYRQDPNRVGGLRHWLRLCVLLAGVTAMVLAAGVAFSRAYWAVLNAPFPALQAVDVKGLARLDRRTVLNTLGVPRNTNLLQLHLDAMQRRLESLAWIRTARIRLEPQGRLVVTVEERRPVALVMVGTPLLLDADGTLFAQARPQDHLDLPFVTRMGDATPKVGSRVPDPFLEDFMGLTKALDALVGQGHARLGTMRSAVSEVRWDPADGLTLILNPKGLTVHLGRGQYGRKWKRLEKLLDLAAQDPSVSELREVDLDFENKAIVRARLSGTRGI
ncbi:cell division protein FtsQ [Desulfacinum hydrothermale DSM 13146]|uniref:Cell division protein FtsQ n=1 Tax=Desulfacinum hydrothermale DSM 13146 TaxID=1121390 RepID=A0A1W1XBA3_9BACT|nr:FtsQ-type POTRA domain-containing protein [Desulfacinum hydrothermale]SMC20958.1 cell division protein FtsQ [Desulfacinum hydrothermale DSM 13146]